MGVAGAPRIEFRCFATPRPSSGAGAAEWGSGVSRSMFTYRVISNCTAINRPSIRLKSDSLPGRVHKPSRIMRAQIKLHQPRHISGRKFAAGEYLVRTRSFIAITTLGKAPPTVQPASPRFCRGTGPNTELGLIARPLTMRSISIKSGYFPGSITRNPEQIIMRCAKVIYGN